MVDTNESCPISRTNRCKGTDSAMRYPQALFLVNCLVHVRYLILAEIDANVQIICMRSKRVAGYMAQSRYRAYERFARVARLGTCLVDLLVGLNLWVRW